MNPLKDEPVQEDHHNIILICQHQLIREGFEKLCQDDNLYILAGHYPDLDRLKSGDFQTISGLLLICQECNRLQLKKLEQILPGIQLVFPNTRMVMINSEFSRKEKVRMITLGVKGFLSRELTVKAMKKAFKAIMDGETWVSRKLTDGLLSELIREKSALSYSRPEARFRLSRREQEILQAMAAGLSNLEISEKLFISEKTVKAHIHHIFKKMGLKNRTQAVLKALEIQPD
jgi:DNA-binding NarL/FixJ family response regulator